LRTETDRLRALLNDLRTLAQPQLNLRPTSLTVVIQAVLTSEISHYQTHQVSIIQDCAPDLPLVQADGERLTQVVLNLCKNALEAMPEGGTLSVHSYRQGTQVVLHIQDTGQGIQDDVEDIFLPFQTTKAKGIGLGLAIVKQLVDAHGGEIEWESEVGQGTTSTLRLPIAAGEGEEA
jgi:two-component system NtrC family sensor kinase